MRSPATGCSRHSTYQATVAVWQVPGAYCNRWQGDTYPVGQILQIRLKFGHPLGVAQFGSYECLSNGCEEPCHRLQQAPNLLSHSCDMVVIGCLLQSMAGRHMSIKRRSGSNTNELGHPLGVAQIGSYECLGNGCEERCHGLQQALDLLSHGCNVVGIGCLLQWAVGRHLSISRRSESKLKR